MSLQLIKQLLCFVFSAKVGTALRRRCSGSGRLNDSGGLLRYCQTSFLLAVSIRSLRRCLSFAITLSCKAPHTHIRAADNIMSTFKHVSLQIPLSNYFGMNDKKFFGVDRYNILVIRMDTVKMVFHSVRWRCWLYDRKGIRPVKKVGAGDDLTGALHIL